MLGSARVLPELRQRHLAKGERNAPNARPVRVEVHAVGRDQRHVGRKVPE